MSGIKYIPVTYIAVIDFKIYNFFIKNRFLFFFLLSLSLYSQERFFFNSIEELEKVSNPLNIGSITEVSGYYFPGDGGHHSRIIVEKSYNKTDIKLSNHDLYATILDSECVNVKWVGAKGNEKDDDTVALQTAIDSFNCLFFPDGVYKTTQPLSIPFGKVMRISGESLWYSRIKGYHNGHILKANYTLFMKFISFERGADFFETAKENGSAGFWTDKYSNNGAAYSKIESCRAMSVGKFGFYLSGTHMYIENNIADKNDWGYYLDGGTNTVVANSAEQCTFSSLHVAGNGNYIANHYADGCCQDYKFGNGILDTDNRSARFGAIHITGTFNSIIQSHFNSNNGAPKFSFEGASARDNSIQGIDIYYEVPKNRHGPTFKFKNAGQNTLLTVGTAYFLGSKKIQNTIFTLPIVNGELGNGKTDSFSVMDTYTKRKN